MAVVRLWGPYASCQGLRGHGPSTCCKTSAAMSTASGPGGSPRGFAHPLLPLTSGVVSGPAPRHSLGPDLALHHDDGEVPGPPPRSPSEADADACWRDPHGNGHFPNRDAAAAAPHGGGWPRGVSPTTVHHPDRPPHHSAGAGDLGCAPACPADGKGGRRLPPSMLVRHRWRERPGLRVAATSVSTSGRSW